ncbi:hypothetical protein I553_9987 [Mycobacterium xenopi 4042]|uniref:Uncharacterized protein n=1 Tax=Mycobacterium xenopi 4042 TaxID=1299334 RepID=X7YR99_MYCXE|nr:hypothetical protein I553_9987 [Mycobacterium xenopi 4042]EUA34967.1 hypothetical protein I552_5756 [Mycobacterium xenopi 3993]
MVVLVTVTFVCEVLPPILLMVNVLPETDATMPGRWDSRRVQQRWGRCCAGRRR